MSREQAIHLTDWEALLACWMGGQPIPWSDPILRHDEFDSGGWLENQGNCAGERIRGMLAEVCGERAADAFHRAGSGFFSGSSFAAFQQDLPKPPPRSSTTRSFAISMNPETIDQRLEAWRQLQVGALTGVPEDVLSILGAYGRLLEAASETGRAILVEQY